MKLNLLQLLGIIVTVAVTFASGLPNVYPKKAQKPPVDATWTAEDNARMRSQCPPISQAELGKHNRTSPLTLGLKGD